MFTWSSGDDNDIVNGGAGIDTLRFIGSAAAERFEISAGPRGNALVTRDVDAVTTTLDRVEHVQLRAGDGQDSVLVRDLTGTDVAQVSVDLYGASNRPPGPDGADDIVIVQGTAGNDVIHLTFEDGVIVVDGLAARTVLRAFEGGDTLRIEGLGGDDLIDASGLADVGINVVLDGGAGDDTAIGEPLSDVPVDVLLG